MTDEKDDRAATGEGGVDPSEGWPEVPPGIAAQLVRALDRSPSTFTVLIGRDLRTRWLSTSASWVSDTDPVSRRGRESLELVHPDDIPKLLNAFEQLNAAIDEKNVIPVLEPVRYRLGSFLGERDGQRLRDQAASWFTGQGVRDAGKLVGVLAPELVAGGTLVAGPR